VEGGKTTKAGGSGEATFVTSKKKKKSAVDVVVTRGPVKGKGLTSQVYGGEKGGKQPGELRRKGRLRFGGEEDTTTVGVKNRGVKKKNRNYMGRVHFG